MRALLFVLILVNCNPDWDSTCSDTHREQRNNSYQPQDRQWPCEGSWERRQWYQQNEQQWYLERCD